MIVEAAAQETREIRGVLFGQFGEPVSDALLAQAGRQIETPGHKLFGNVAEQSVHCQTDFSKHLLLLLWRIRYERHLDSR